MICRYSAQRGFVCAKQPSLTSRIAPAAVRAENSLANAAGDTSRPCSARRSMISGQWLVGPAHRPDNLIADGTGLPPPGALGEHVFHAHLFEAGVELDHRRTGVERAQAGDLLVLLQECRECRGHIHLLEVIDRLCLKIAGAGGGTRTRMSLTSSDFESDAYANFATPAA